MINAVNNPCKLCFLCDDVTFVWSPQKYARLWPQNSLWSQGNNACYVDMEVIISRWRGTKTLVIITQTWHAPCVGQCSVSIVRWDTETVSLKRHYQRRPNQHTIKNRPSNQQFTFLPNQALCLISPNTVRPPDWSTPAASVLLGHENVKYSSSLSLTKTHSNKF